MQLITGLGFIRLGFETVVDPWSWGTRYSGWDIDSAWWGCVSRPSHDLIGNGQPATSRDIGIMNKDLGVSREATRG